MMTIGVFKFKLFSALESVLKLMLAWLIILLLFTVFELLFSGLTRAYPDAIFKFILLSVLNNFLFWFKIWVFVVLIYIALYFIKPKLANVVTIVFLLFLSILQLVLINYFNTALIPLGSDLFGYSITDIKQTVGASSGLSVIPIVSIVLLLLGCVFILIYLPKWIKVNLLSAILVPVFSILIYFLNTTSVVNLLRLNSEYDNNLAINKADFFLTSSTLYFFPASMDTDIYADSYIDLFDGEEADRTATATAFVYPDESNYPFYHTNEAPDVLSPFFKPLKTAPNVVILLVEGLGRAFTNEGAYLGNFTPYLDSLANKSLYWKNFLSGGGRTFGVLPSVMGSMPFGKNGILEMGSKIPKHESLYSLLKFNGYYSSFYYGGDATFDNMNYFLSQNAVDEVKDVKTIPASYTKLPSKGNGFTWGYADDQVYSYYLSNLAKQNQAKPKIDVILTVATHDPFLIPNQSKYLKIFEQRMTTLGFDETKKAAYRNFQLQYSSILYADESIKNFINAYQKRPDYENTIFFITGDHRMPEIPMSTKIDRYHVPLIVFSPLLSRTAKMESISTHFDITPSILAFFKKNLNMKLPSGGSWLGDGLDTARSFRNIHSYPLIQTKTTMVDFVQGEYHLNTNQLFKLNADLSEAPIQDPDKLNQITAGFNKFKAKNDKISQGAKLIPDSIYNKYKPR